MKAVYYPGCTLYEKEKEFDRGAKKIASALGLDFMELPDWTCCGAAYPLATDNIIAMISAARILSNARKYGDHLTTLCSFCYNVLKRVNNTILLDKEKRMKINTFLDLSDTNEGVYNGEMKVVHYIELLKEFGFDKISKMIKKPLGLKIAPYYGCQLLRPEKELHIDIADNPSIFENLIKSIGGTVINSPYKTECCGSYHILKQPDVAYRCSYNILNDAILKNADAIAVTCPLCYFNLEREQSKILIHYTNLKNMPVFYFTELICLALDIKSDYSRHSVNITNLIDKHVGVKT